VFASRENLNPLACADKLIPSQTRRSFLNGLAEQNERGDFVISGYLHLSLGTKATVQIHLTASFVEGSSHRRRGGGSTGLDCSAAGADFLPQASPNVRTCEGARPNDSMFHFEKGSSIESSECAAVPSFCADLSRMLVAKLPVLIRHRSMIRASPIETSGFSWAGVT
jgi:hypothetical protein